MSEDNSMLVQDVTRRSITNFIEGQMYDDYNMIRRVIGEGDTPVVMLQHATLITGFAGSMFEFLASFEDELPEEILHGLLLAITEIAAQSFYAEKEEQRKEAT